MSLNSRAILDRVISHAMASGQFDRVAGHEPKNAPGNGLSCAVWVDRIEPVDEASGLNSTSAKVTVNVRVYGNMLAEPQDAIDPNMADAVDALMAAYTRDFTLGGTVRNIELLGETGAGMFAQAGYLEIDRKLYRVMTITVPAIVSDAWTQGG